MLTHKAPHTYSMDDLRTMLKACQSHTDRLILFAFIFTGMREGEVIRLSWKPARDYETETRAFVDFERDCIVITGAKGARGGKSRNVPLHPLLREELKNRLGDPAVWAEEEAGITRNGDEWLFPEPNEVRRVMRRLLKDVKTPGAEHIFRKTALTWWDRHAVRDIVAKAIVGHAAQGVTEVHYLATDDAEKRAAIDGLYAGEIDGTTPVTPATLKLVEGGDLRKVIEEQAATIKTLTAMLAGKEVTA